MRRLTDAELDLRIHQFLNRKRVEFPELARQHKKQPRTPWRYIGHWPDRWSTG